MIQICPLHSQQRLRGKALSGKFKCSDFLSRHRPFARSLSSPLQEFRATQGTVQELCLDLEPLPYIQRRSAPIILMGITLTLFNRSVIKSKQLKTCCVQLPILNCARKALFCLMVIKHGVHFFTQSSFPCSRKNGNHRIINTYHPKI